MIPYRCHPGFRDPRKTGTHRRWTLPSGFGVAAMPLLGASERMGPGLRLRRNRDDNVGFGGGNPLTRFAGAPPGGEQLERGR